MAELVTIHLSRALKLKNRVVRRLSQLDSLVVEENSQLEDNQQYDIRKLYLDRLVLAEQLVRLKTALTLANQPIQQLIFELAECKALVAVLHRVNTRHGVSFEGMSGVKAMYFAQFRKPDIDREVRRVEQEIDRIQDELDQFNHRTTIDVDAALLAIAEAEDATR